MPKFNPLQYAGCYSLHLYCDRECGAENCGHSDYETAMGEFAGDTLAECIREARKSGWTVHRTTRTATCRACNALTEKARKVLR